MAPHLDGVHVVFGLVISGFEVIKKIEGLKTDSASRPYADVRVVDCGQLIVKSANDVLEGKKIRASHSADSSLNSSDSSSESSSFGESESDPEKSRYRKHRRHRKNKRAKKRRRLSVGENVDPESSKKSSPKPAEEIGEAAMEGDKDHGGKREKPVVRPEEIPPVPENRFLLRQDVPAQENKVETVEKQESTLEAEQKPAVSKSGRKIRGRGTIRYHTPTRSKSRSASVGERGSSETPPHWKEEMMRIKAYQPSSVERWSKGDQWDNRSESAWSRSSERSSGRSSERSSPPRPPRKEKKRVKHKKKTKKRKHGKKRSSKGKHQEHFPSEGERSPSSRRSRSRSRSSSSRHNTRGRSSRSRSYSRSHGSSRSRSRARSYSRSSSYSRSRSPSRSRSHSHARFRSRSYSRSRSRHRSRSYTPSRKKSLSRSPRKQKSSKLKADTAVNVPGKLSDSKGTPASKMLTAPAPESITVIPLSDSPPPSRWKPGQKPWRPSYIPPTQDNKPQISLVNISVNAPSLVQEKGAPAESEQDKRVTPRSPSRSPKGKSCSRSRSRSVSKSSSRCRHSSGSDSGHKKRKKSLDKAWKKYYRSLKRIKNIDKYVSAATAKDELFQKKACVEPSPDKAISTGIKEECGFQAEDTKNYSSMQVDSLNNKSEWDSDSDKASQSNSDFLSKHPKPSGHITDKTTSGPTGWNSDSEPENITTRAPALSEKEEGEASSESEREAQKMASSTAEVAAAPSPVRVSPEKAAESGKHKSKRKSKRKRKHKSRAEGKGGSHHTKDKSKRPKKKRQKLKETFHWQPPLEFGEEEDEDDSKREKPSPMAAVLKDQNSTSSNKNPNREENRVPLRVRDNNNKNTKQSEPHQQPSNRTSNNTSTLNEQNTLDDMDICTPEHDSKTAVEAAAVCGNTSETPPKMTSNMTTKSSKGALPQVQNQEQSSITVTDLDKPTGAVINFKWRPLKGMASLQNMNTAQLMTQNQHLHQSQMANAQGVRMEIKSTNRVRPGSLFDEVRKTVRLNRRPRNQESSGEESSPSEGVTRDDSPRKSRSDTRRSRSASSQRSRTRDWSRSYSRSRSRSRSSSYSSRGRSRSRRRHGRSRSSTYRSYRSHSRTYSRSHTRSRSYNYHRRSRSASSDSYSSRSRSGSRRRRRHRSDSYLSSDRRSRSSRSSSRSSSRGRSRSRSSRYS